jgi:hypothetical protein
VTQLTSPRVTEAVVIGIDFGTFSGRAPVVRVKDGEATGELLAPDWALQVRSDHIDAMFAGYTTLHDYFGRGGNDVMQRLRARRREVHGGAQAPAFTDTPSDLSQTPLEPPQRAPRRGRPRSRTPNPPRPVRGREPPMTVNADVRQSIRSLRASVGPARRAHPLRAGHLDGRQRLGPGARCGPDGDQAVGSVL